MILYHGSWCAIESPDVSFSRDNVDFGKGFYTTPFKEQARKWAERLKRPKGASVLSVYELDDSAFETLNILEFDSYSKAWLEFITDCRKGNPASGEYDIISGSVADDKVFDTIEKYLRDYITWEKALSRLRYERPNWQYCFKKQTAIDCYLHYVSSEVVR
ncbi:MAG: DUF3990 domain-containing protein [Peptococcaceae bacterium]|jgi:hypothetical protein|nr:DUF3990 domain-containing protein [Peptococcaceae bacterium]